MKIKGIIKTKPTVTERPDYTLVAYNINGELYSTFNEAFQGFKMGDEVEIDYEKDKKTGKYNNITTMNLIGKKELAQFKNSSGEEEPILDTQRIIVRQNALTNANELLKTCYDRYMEKMSNPVKVLTDIAKELEEWVLREN